MLMSACGAGSLLADEGLLHTTDIRDGGVYLFIFFVEEKSRHCKFHCDQLKPMVDIGFKM